MTVRTTIDRYDQSASRAKFNLRMTRKWQKYIYIYFFPAGNCYRSPKMWYNPNLKHLTINICFKDSLLWFPQWVSWYHPPPTLLVVVFSPWIFWWLFTYMWWSYDMSLVLVDRSNLRLKFPHLTNPNSLILPRCWWTSSPPLSPQLHPMDWPRSPPGSSPASSLSLSLSSSMWSSYLESGPTLK